MVAIEVVMVNNHVCRLDRRVFVYFLSCTYMSSHLSRLFFISAIFMLLSQAGVITVVEVVVTEVAAVEIMEAVVETMEAVTDIHRFEFCRYFALKWIVSDFLYFIFAQSNQQYDGRRDQYSDSYGQQQQGYGGYRQSMFVVVHVCKPIFVDNDELSP